MEGYALDITQDSKMLWISYLSEVFLIHLDQPHAVLWSSAGPAVALRRSGQAILVAGAHADRLLTIPDHTWASRLASGRLS